MRPEEARIADLEHRLSVAEAALAAKAATESQGEAIYRALFDGMDEACCVIEIVDGAGGAPDYRFILANDAFVRQTGVAEPVGRTARELVPRHEEIWFETFRRVARSRIAERFEQEAAALGRRFDVYAFPIGAPERSQVAVLLRDIADRKRDEAMLRTGEERLRRVVGELQHRLRNTLSVVRSILLRSVDDAPDLRNALDHFRGRLDALARSQVIVSRTADGSVDLEMSLRDELLSVGASDGPSLGIAGPAVALRSPHAETLGLAFHELVTNALKFGALKVQGARLTISWRTSLDHEGTPRLHLVWEEQGVPAVPVQPRRGFGRELIEEALPYRLGAETALEFRGGGIRCSIVVPLRPPGDAASSDWLGGRS